MAAHSDIGVPRSWGLSVRLRAFIDRLELDRRLAGGESPAESPELGRRAQVLSHWRVRHSLADSLERVVIEAIAPARDRGAAVPVQRAEVVSAQPDLLRLVAALRSEPAPSLRSIAAVSLLLADGAGPLFAPHPSGTLAEVAFQAAFLAEAD
jgi:hypothetical protein